MGERRQGFISSSAPYLQDDLAQVELLIRPRSRFPGQIVPKPPSSSQMQSRFSVTLERKKKQWSFQNSLFLGLFKLLKPFKLFTRNETKQNIETTL